MDTSIQNAVAVDQFLQWKEQGLLDDKLYEYSFKNEVTQHLASYNSYYLFGRVLFLEN